MELALLVLECSNSVPVRSIPSKPTSAVTCTDVTAFVQRLGKSLEPTARLLGHQVTRPRAHGCNVVAPVMVETIPQSSDCE